jgi:hypothetical protein
VVYIHKIRSTLILNSQRAEYRDPLFPLYHYTSHTSPLLISRKCFRVSNGGGGRFQTSDVGSDGNSGGGGVYFTTRDPACYDIGNWKRWV